MKRIRGLFLPLLSLLFPVLGGCDYDVPDYPNTPTGNFEALWQMLDERYCFFDYKEVDWDEVHDRYKAKIQPGMKDVAMFNLLAEMLAELKDGHVNLTSAFDMARYWKWFEDFPPNFDENILERNYLLPDYRIAGGMKYKKLTSDIGYIYFGSFVAGVGESNLDYILATFLDCKGIIIDVRNNGGGTMTYVNTIAGRFTDKRILTGYIRHKTGKGHNDFSKPYATYLDPASGVHFDGKVVVLTNRSSYSATNNFVSVMKELPQVTVVGDSTGGGSGMPFSSEIPRGWSVRFSASPIYNSRMEQTEFGIAPHIRQDMEKDDMLEGKDSIIERAVALLNETE